MIHFIRYDSDGELNYDEFTSKEELRRYLDANAYDMGELAKELRNGFSPGHGARIIDGNAIMPVQVQVWSFE